MQLVAEMDEKNEKNKILFYGKDLSAEEVEKEIRRINPNKSMKDVLFSSTPPHRDFEGVSAEIHKIVYCKKCGKVINEGSICPKCGTQN